jgi:hypothetical protein
VICTANHKEQYCSMLSGSSGSSSSGSGSGSSSGNSSCSCGVVVIGGAVADIKCTIAVASQPSATYYT